MYDLSNITAGMTVIGADEVPVGNVRLRGGYRTKVEAAGKGDHADHHHYVPSGLVTGIDGNFSQLSATGANSTLLDEGGGRLRRRLRSRRPNRPVLRQKR